jgi:hypothetical protein
MIAVTEYTNVSIEETILEVLERDVLCRPRSTFSLDDHLVYDLKIDSDDISFIFIKELESRFGVYPKSEEWQQVRTGTRCSEAAVQVLDRLGNRQGSWCRK